jgi:hypothetical protein
MDIIVLRRIFQRKLNYYASREQMCVHRLIFQRGYHIRSKYVHIAVGFFYLQFVILISIRAFVAEVQDLESMCCVFCWDHYVFSQCA